jgi:ABC-2 type transport system ATP-binding protein
MSDMPAIEVQDLKKSFGENQAVQGVSFEVNQGEIFSLLGPNGAGKTTTISMLSCLLSPNDGDARVMGHSIRSDSMGVKSVLGVVPQELALYEDLTARENLSFWGKMYGLRGSALKSRVSEVLDVIGLSDRANDRVGKYSGGMKRRVNIGVALLHKPKVIYMDEPTVGIDPQSRRNILDSVVALKDQGMTVLYTTHYMEEAQELSDHIAIMDHGRMIACGTNDELVKLVGGQTRIDLTVNVEPGRIAGESCERVHENERGSDPARLARCCDSTERNDGSVCSARWKSVCAEKKRRHHGTDVAGRVKLYAPNPFESGSSVSHFDVSALPNILMAVGGLGALIGLFVNGKQFAFSWLVAFMFFLSICLGGMFLTIIHHLFKICRNPILIQYAIGSIVPAVL